MATGIQWTDETHNFWKGCDKISAGCKFCYAAREFDRWKLGPFSILTRTKGFLNPLGYAARIGEGKYWKGMKIFVGSWMDFFIDRPEVKEWRASAWEVIRDTPEFQYQILTKRADKILDMLPDDWGPDYDHVWIGVSMEDQKSFNERIQHLAKVPAKIKFISAEPLISSINMLYPEEIHPPKHSFESYSSSSMLAPPENPPLLHEAGIKWVIVGGESGNENGKHKYRPCQVEWIADIVSQCTWIDVPVFVKQMGTQLYKDLDLSDRHGGNMEEWPSHLQVRQFPHDYNSLIAHLQLN